MYSYSILYFGNAVRKVHIYTYLSSSTCLPFVDSGSPRLQRIQRPWFLGSKLTLTGNRFLGHLMMIFTRQHAVWGYQLIMQSQYMIITSRLPVVRPSGKLLRDSYTVTGQNQCTVHTHGVGALGALVGLCCKPSLRLVICSHLVHCLLIPNFIGSCSASAEGAKSTLCYPYQPLFWALPSNR